MNKKRKMKRRESASHFTHLQEKKEKKKRENLCNDEIKKKSNSIFPLFKISSGGRTKEKGGKNEQ
jgi:hypothetical protein